MKPKYLFYIVMIVVLHYEVGRLVSNGESRDIDDSSYEKGVRLNDTSNKSDIEFTYQDKDIKLKGVHQLRIINAHHYKQCHFKIW
ncbi:hypothetical protein [Mucilaginibacter jinjuensis]|uniref:Uncharacterized protein n=1 Tax=Mucilaginibacter jinjuensis TaxID=1176721 RepID=A0ABY7TH92_9SPHI|nr:hypothetical protein [Mucilaginibacter jinjuensis]WCT14952.1 hypothetical protein PQO05_13500 [Mucilaginibacter jinjuensis]